MQGASEESQLLYLLPQVFLGAHPDSQHRERPLFGANLLSIYGALDARSRARPSSATKIRKNGLGIRLRRACASVSLATELEEKPQMQAPGEKHRFSQEYRALINRLTVLERAAIGALAGGVAGAFTYACLHPLDTVKTRLQTRGAAAVHKNSVDVAVTILKSKGIAGFYSGISAVIVGSAISSAIYFGTCEFGKSILSKIERFPPLLIPPAASALGNIVSSAILVPKEVITQRMQAGAKGRSWQVLKRTLENEGVAGLYSGYSAAILRNLPAGVISFTSFEYLRAGWLRITQRDTLEPWQSVSSGALAGALAAALTTPLDVVKTRLMTQAKAGVMDAATSAAARDKVAAFTYQGVASTLQKIWLEEGWAGLTRGAGPRLLHSACFSAIGFFAFETARVAILKQHLARKQASAAAEDMQQPPSEV